MARRLWTSFDAGMRPRWEFGRIDQPEYQLGFAEISNFIIENGVLRKRPGIHRCGKDTSGNTMNGSSFPYTLNSGLYSGHSQYAWQSTNSSTEAGFFKWVAIGSRATGETVRWQPQTLSLPPAGIFWVYESLAAYYYGAAESKFVVKYDGDSLPTHYSGRTGIIVEAGGRRFLFWTGPLQTEVINVYASRTNDLTNYTFRDPGGILYDDDPIEVTLNGYGDVVWAYEGFGLFMGTSKGLYELVSGLGPGFSPYSGGFFPQIIDNTPTLTYGGRSISCMTKETICFLSDVDEISFFNKQARQIQKKRLDIAVTEMVTMLAYFGGDIVAVLVRDISEALDPNYGTSSRILFVSENSGAVTQLALPVKSLAGCMGSGIFMSMRSETISPFVGFLPFSNSRVRYASLPADEAVDDYYDHLGYDSTNRAFTAKITTLPIHWGPDLGDVRRPLKAVVRVDQTRHFKIGVLGQTLAEWTYAVAAPALFTGDVTVLFDAPAEQYSQITIEDNSSYPCNILAIQIEAETGEGGLKDD